MAQINLGYCYANGEGVRQNYKLAIYWYKKASAKNDPMALCNLGLFYEQGKGVNPSNRWAKYYFLRALKQGFQKAQLHLNHL